MDLSWTLHQFLIEKSKHVLLPDKNLNPLKLSIIRWISLLSLAGKSSPNVSQNSVIFALVNISKSRNYLNPLKLNIIHILYYLLA